MARLYQIFFIFKRLRFKKFIPDNHRKQSALYRYDTKNHEIREVFAASDDVGDGDKEV